jgi:hypothetical protein
VLFGRAQTHVKKEISEIITPALAYENAPCSVIGVASIVGIMASLLHTLPYFVFRCFGSAMNVHLRGGSLTRKTAAASGGFTEICRRSNGVLAAIAMAKPHRIASFRDKLPSNHHKTAEAFSLNIQELTHRILLQFGCLTAPNLYAMGLFVNIEWDRQ